MTVLRGAIVGFGAVAEHGHWPAYRESPDFRITAVVDPSAGRREAAVRADPGVHAYASLAELALRETIDIVDICTPPAAHVELAVEALRNGWHVICEKPLTLDGRHYRRLRSAAEESGRVLFTVHNWKMAPIVRAAGAAVAAGTVGTVRTVDVFTWRNSHCKGVTQGAAGAGPGEGDENWRLRRSTAGGGVLVDHGWHAFYLVLSLVSAEPRRVRAIMHVPTGGADALEDSADVSVAFAEAEARIHLTWRAPQRRNLIVVGGDRGSVVIDDDRLLVMPGDGAWSERVFEAPLSGGSHHADWFGGLLEAFRAEIADPAARGANLREAGWCVALTDAAYRAAGAADPEADVRFP
jgi:predicted dehydrogenase